jgi:hypothetical protein
MRLLARKSQSPRPRMMTLLSVVRDLELVRVLVASALVCKHAAVLIAVLVLKWSGVCHVCSIRLCDNSLPARVSTPCFCPRTD